MGEEGYVEEELGKAREALADAEQLAKGEGSDAGIVNRLYYACFHAAQAALYDRDVDPPSHGAVRRLFGKELVLEGEATRDQGRLLTTLADLRQQADYGYDPLDVDVAELREQSTAFVAEIEALVQDDTDSTDG